MAFTFFFRDAQNLETALDDAAPRLAGRAFIHIWDAGCAHGPEPYTLAMLLRERVSEYVFRNVRIHATDVDANFAGQVGSGVFPQREVQRIPPAVFEKYFQPAAAPGYVEVVPEIRQKITFSRHDLLSLQPIREGLSMIVCKNVLLHFDEAQRRRVLSMFHAALAPDGVLVMEHTQKMPEQFAPHFRQIVSHVQAFRKVEAAPADGAPLDGPHRRNVAARSCSGEP